MTTSYQKVPPAGSTGKSATRYEASMWTSPDRPGPALQPDGFIRMAH